MKLAGDYTFDAPGTEVWKAMLDPVVLAATMPGCERLEIVDGQYVGELNIKVGPVQGKFTSKIDLVDVVEGKSYTLKVDGRGAPGFVKATAHVALEPGGDTTKILYDSDASVGGRIASVGQRLIEASAKAIIKQSLEGMNEIVRTRAAAAAPPPPSDSDGAAPVAGAPLQPEAATSLPPPKPVDQTQFAMAVAKEVGKSMFPRVALWVVGALILAALLRLLLAHLK